MRRSIFLRLAVIAGVIGAGLASIGDAKAGRFRLRRDRPGIVGRAGRVAAVVLPPWTSCHRGRRHRGCD